MHKLFLIFKYNLKYCSICVLLLFSRINFQIVGMVNKQDKEIQNQNRERQQSEHDDDELGVGINVH